jgi:hypothetical protein
LKLLIRVIAGSIAFFLSALALLLFFGISNEPEIKLDWSVGSADILRAKTLLHEGSKTRVNHVGTITLSQADLNLTTNYLLNRFTQGRAQIFLQPNKLKFVVSAALPKNNLGKYVNITFRLGNEDGAALPTLTKFKAGKLLLPSKLAGWVIDTVIKNSRLNEYVILATDSIQAVKIDADKISVTYQPSRATLTTARDFLTHSETIDDRAKIYRDTLNEIVRKHDPAWRLSLADLFKPLFAIALQRSSSETAIEENRLVIFTVNNYVNQMENAETHFPAFLYKRIDLAQHFTGAAAITASINSQMAQIMSEEKEIQDAKTGSGFSFIDLCADRAGARFGEMATTNPQTARQLQKKMAAVKDYSEFMPDPRQLPEQMNEKAFAERYGNMKSQAYQEVSKQIDALIDATPLFKNP